MPFHIKEKAPGGDLGLSERPGQAFAALAAIAAPPGDRKQDSHTLTRVVYLAMYAHQRPALGQCGGVDVRSASELGPAGTNFAARAEQMRADVKKPQGVQGALGLSLLRRPPGAFGPDVGQASRTTP